MKLFCGKRKKREGDRIAFSSVNASSDLLLCQDDYFDTASADAVRGLNMSPKTVSLIRNCRSP